MKTFWLVIALWPLAALAQIELLPGVDPEAVFAAQSQNIRVTLRNPGNKTASRDMQIRLFQVSSGSAVPLGKAKPWKTIQMYPQQTVIETLALQFPAIRAPMRFQIEFVGIGRADVMAYPNDLLKRLKLLAGELPLGVFDPDAHLKPLLKQAGVEFTDFEIGPADSKLTLVWSDALTLPDSVLTRVKTGMVTVWIRSAPAPATYAAHLGSGVVVVAPAATLDGLAGSPLPQLTLLRDAEFALEPESLRLPSDTQPQ